MPPKGTKGRGKKAGEKTQENVVDSTTKQQLLDEKSKKMEDEVEPSDKKTTKRKPLVRQIEVSENGGTNDNVGDNEVIPEKRARGRKETNKLVEKKTTASVSTSPSNTEKKEASSSALKAVGKQPKNRRGNKKAVETVAQKNDEKDEKSKDENVESQIDKESEISKATTNSSNEAPEIDKPESRRRRKKIENDVATDTKEEDKNQTKSVSVALKKIKAANGEEKESGDGPAKRQKAVKKPAPKKEKVSQPKEIKNGGDDNKKPVKTAGAKKVIGGRKGRKRVAVGVDKEVHDEQNGGVEVEN